MKVIYVEDEIEINLYSAKTEKSSESIFGLDENNNIIQQFTFSDNIGIRDEPAFKNIIENCQHETLETGFLLYSFKYECSFGHYMGQTVPKIYDYLESYKNYNLLIPEHKYNKLCKEILQLLNVSFDKIVILKSYVIYNIIDYAKSPVYHTVPSMPTITHLNVYNRMREPLLIQKNENPNRLVYLKRDGTPNVDFGNSETGNLRYIINENELINELMTKNFEIITLGDKTISEKNKSLSNIKTLITPLGANCFNLLFCNAPENIIFITNNDCFGFEYYVALCEELNKTKINASLLRFHSITPDPLNQWNSSFAVNINDLLHHIPA